MRGSSLLPLLLTACLTNPDLYAQRTALLTDQDGDGQSEEQGDCDDNDPLRFAGATEACDGEDDDCDGAIDEDGTDITWYTDIDQDGYGDSASAVLSCAPPGDHYVRNADDCDDRAISVHPGALERCNDIDDNCDQSIDNDPVDPSRYHIDGDADGYGSITETTWACEPPSEAWLETGTDCDDANPDVHPFAPELCDELDNDCDGNVDDPPLTGANAFYPDDDRDGFGDGSSTRAACVPTESYIEIAGDCDDNDATVNPDQAEVCNDGKNNDCSTEETTCVWPAEIDMDDHVMISGTAAYNYVGAAGAAGDVTGDGVRDLLVGVGGGYQTSSGDRLGVVSIFHAPIVTSDTYSSAPQQIYGPAEDSFFGYGLAVADINGDGQEDMIIGATSVDSSAYHDAGQLSILYGPQRLSGSTTTLEDAAITGNADDEEVGYFITLVGDTNGDGKEDYVAGSEFMTVKGESWAGGMYLFTAPPPAGTSTANVAAAAKLTGTARNEAFGISVGGGDVDGDGLSDILVGAPSGSVSGARSGEAYIFFGPISGDQTNVTADILMTGELVGGRAGIGCDVIGDANADGYEDMVVTADQAAYGSAYVIFGDSALVDMGLQDAGLKFRGDRTDRLFGFAVSHLDDLNSDGAVDLAFSSSPTGDEATEILVFWGPFSPSGGAIQAFAEADVTLNDDVGGYIQDVMTNVGDLDRDGVNDLLVGSRRYGSSSASTDSTGMAYLISGVGM